MGEEQGRAGGGKGERKRHYGRTETPPSYNALVGGVRRGREEAKDESNTKKALSILALAQRGQVAWRRRREVEERGGGEKPKGVCIVLPLP